MKIKATLLTLLLFVSVGLAGCSSNSDKSSNQSDNKVEKQSSSSNKSSSESSSNDNNNQSSSQSNDSQASSNSSSKAKVSYRTVNFEAQLDDINDSRLYKNVPMSRNAKTYSWDSVNAHEGQNIYVDKKALVRTRDRDHDDDYDDDDDKHDDDNGYDTEEYYRIRFSSNENSAKYWVEEDVVDDGD
ncbi:hypothetical protein [Lentilactobacillus sp. Marseille-Q4993]|uniref:hypothetical protein n=1 Tax=Lentilactobacillus sp. Marseille-Q4993 TaxID=3039492 RepID=UPI0024BC3D2E|nr:hypothetical protein [Lentilactobacillus sp. Marseille-Q4993]